LGEVNTREATNLSEKLKEEPGWNPLKAFTLLIFVMLYAPCLTTVAVMKRETGSWKWPLFAMVYTTTLAYVVALSISIIGRFLGLGIS
jgi:ferrous iron transport protein B